MVRLEGKAATIGRSASGCLSLTAAERLGLKGADHPDAS